MEEQQEISWQAKEYDFQEKRRDWYFAVWIVAIAVAVSAILFENYLMAVLIVVSAFALSVAGSRKPKIIECVLIKKGVNISGEFHRFEDLQSFCIEESQNNRAKLLLRTKHFFSSLLIIPIENINPENVREFLSSYLPEEEIYEPLTQKAVEFLGF